LAGTSRNGLSSALAYTEAGLPLSEAWTGGLLDGLTVSRGYDTALRRTSLSLNTQPSGIAIGYGFDAAGRLAAVTNGASTFAYGLHPNSLLLASTTFKQSGTTRLTASRTYDFLNRLTSIASGSVSFAYDYNQANQVMRVTQGEGSFWRYEYDALGQVTTARRYWADGTPVAGQQFDYAFDDIGNRLSTQAGGDAAGGNRRTNTYTATLLNQYASRTVAGGADVVGLESGA
jgi:YD repeat-containing protein